MNIISNNRTQIGLARKEIRKNALIVASLFRQYKYLYCCVLVFWPKLYNFNCEPVYWSIIMRKQMYVNDSKYTTLHTAVADLCLPHLSNYLCVMFSVTSKNANNHPTDVYHEVFRVIRSIELFPIGFFGMTSYTLTAH